MYRRITASLIIASSTFLFIFAAAQAAPTSTIVQNLVISGVPNAPCLTTNGSGLVASSTNCGAGPTTTVNGLNNGSNTFTLVGGGGLTIATSSTSTVTFTQAPGVATSVINGVQGPTFTIHIVNTSTASSITTSSANLFLNLLQYTSGTDINVSTNGTINFVNTLGYISNISTTINTASPLSGGGNLTNNSTLSLTCATCLTANQSITWTGSGDATGTASGATSLTPTLHVVALQGSAVSSTAPATGTVLEWNGSSWAPLATSSLGISAGGGAATSTFQFIIEYPNVNENDAIYEANTTTTLTSCAAVNLGAADTLKWGLNFATSTQRGAATNTMQQAFTSMNTSTSTTALFSPNGSTTIPKLGSVVFWTTSSSTQASSSQFSLTCNISL